MTPVLLCKVFLFTKRVEVGKADRVILYQPLTVSHNASIMQPSKVKGCNSEKAVQLTR